MEKAWNQYPAEREEKEITGEVAITKLVFDKLQTEIKNLNVFKAILEKLFIGGATQLVEAVLAGAMVLDASDIHFEPEKEAVRFRLRLDGVLEDILTLPYSAYKPLLDRVKLLSGLKLNIHEQAQDGRFTIIVTNEIEIRTSILPGAWGENIVMRILNPEATKLTLENLGFREDDLKIIHDELRKPTGMILATGPTGSGKTTTLYAFIKLILTSEIKIITIEDPIEYHIMGVSQTQVEPDKGYTFANGLRSIVRQDPDVILVGEIRDLETAEIAMHASLTGHLVLSTLHTNDAPGTIPRLIDLGVKPPIIAPAINVAIAQRLVRRVCKKCAEMRPITKPELESLKKVMANLSARAKLPVDLNEKVKIPVANKCPDCDTGYSGRIAVVELFQIDDEMERLIITSPAEAEVRANAKRKGMVTMIQDAAIKILSGMTTIEEAERVLGKFI
ncbi:hypothetical protein A2833_02680 [Candidatus Azambacteria bacterium RIFCSPHIGHO2_01_FULL_44_55]|uniref:Bacterial type II secretion system protein E domain-containing protein n=1 Tax=Candidatus Azambacteria bacterium RIFCSPLOWO2_02_FULL_44_14 TaxID=1797306 RepID=A0A1F5CBA0_9BACT|nr:MAG: hypothetical protein A3A18_00705 [Candidatus Azambacteria bacterium RIFCSPLOWO2_01_FULL_44_84]OGD33071.1 MAG: hypothetical protein A3C78_01480 [Candidatus Azambacteria bacterium RIFCSPHIGHO2_02_FULL_45_18]OGD40085.1 MAG: hypothetical protein A3I30_02535 [Candidatus Azambacteria bacterium RIFCSPLOWO2_02_FULL_44_14]OGD40928.1 MAG: hypothetical protein A2833_02680 [Candidatus Azambacteria bacterium RIFCSPHIGHO2_01_FULL_44_55]